MTSSAKISQALLRVLGAPASETRVLRPPLPTSGGLFIPLQCGRRSRGTARRVAGRHLCDLPVY